MRYLIRSVIAITMDKEEKSYFGLRAHIKTMDWLFHEEVLKVAK